MNVIDQASGENWHLYNADCVEAVRGLPSNSVGLSVYSPPFSNLYVYSDSARDMGNSADDEEFFEHYKLMLPELLRATIPGRLCAVHCKELVDYKGRDGRAGLRDFPGELIRAHEECGWKYHSRITIWKCPVTEMQRTKAHGLLYKQLRADSSFSRQGLAEYVLVFRKWATEEDEVEPVTHTTETFPLDQWQKYASPVWMDIDQTNVLNVAVAREDQDEKHLCVAEGTLVLTRSGYKPIESLELGEDVLTHMGRWRPVTAKAQLGKKPVVQTKAHGVPMLVTTPDHKLWTRVASGDHARRKMRSAEPGWVEAQETTGSYLNLKLPPVSDTKLTLQECWIVGRWLADGHVGARGEYVVSVGRHKVEHFLERAGAHVGTVNDATTAAQYRLKGLSAHVKDVLSKCGKGAANKVVPGTLTELPQEHAEWLLSGYLSGDGHVDKLGRWHVSSVSRSLLLGMALVAQRARGLVASVYASKPAGKHVIEGREVDAKQLWVMLLSPHNASAAVLCDGAWKKVRSVSDAGEAEVWDITVDEDHSFTAEGCVVKNCPLQLDVIERCVKLWSNPGNVVFSPFAGIGSEGHVALALGRKFVGVELKPAYFHRAAKNLAAACQGDRQITIFDALAAT